jgi:fatty acid desaturase
MNKFKKDKNYLLRYCIQTLVFFITLDSFLYSKNGLNTHFSPTHNELFLPLLAILLCGLPSSIMHNCAHGNIKPRLLNNIIGEICGTIMLYGFKGFSLAHMFHHIHPDDPKMDPHPPRGYTFLRFVISPIEATLRVVECGYYEFFGENKKTRMNIKIQIILFNLGLFCRVIFWFLLLGPNLFILAYLPIYMANIFVFAHINYAAHIERFDGSSEIINLNHNIYYKFINLVSLGGYFHKSHHLKPGAFNPAKVKINEEVDYITFIPQVTVPKRERKPIYALAFQHGLK